MKTIYINRFDGGMTEDVYNASAGEFSITKQFDILTYPGRLYPLRGMTADTTSTGIGNLTNASDGLMYGIGTNAASGRLWQRSGYGATDVWQHVPINDQLAPTNVVYDFLVDWPNAGNIRTIHWASTNTLLASDPAGGGSAAQQALTFTTIGQGYVHPKDNILYFPYNTSSASLVGAITSNGSAFGAFNATALTAIPKQYRSYCLTSFGNYLAIPVSNTVSGSSVNGSLVYLWDRDTSLNTISESIQWGAGYLKVLNNLNGILIGISELGSDSLQAGVTQDFNAIQIKAYAGGTEPTLIKEIKANHLPGTNRPSVSINPRVNFVYKNRLYFSINVNPNDGVSPSYYGLFSVGKNKTTGQYAVTMERMATNDNSETSVIAAAIAGDFVSMVHTAVGTLTFTINGQTSSSTYGATSVYESPVNPNMTLLDKTALKNLVAVAIMTTPLTSGAQVVMKCRVDSNPTGSWTTLFTKTATSPDTLLTSYETPILPSMAVPDGINYEFRLESTGGAQIVGYLYKFQVKESNL